MDTPQETRTEEQKKMAKAKQWLRVVLDELEEDSIPVLLPGADDPIAFPRAALQLLYKILDGLAQGRQVEVQVLKDEMTTGEAARILNVSRPTVVSLLENGAIPYRKLGSHRRILREDVLAYRKAMKDRQRRLLAEITEADEADGLYEA